MATWRFQNIALWLLWSLSPARSRNNVRLHQDVEQ